MSRVESMLDKRSSEVVIGTNNNEIERDEVRWAKFLESYQKRVCEKFLELFMIHLSFIGYTKQYELDVSKLKITMTAPNNYADRIAQSVKQQRFDNYQALQGNQEFPRSFLMRMYLKYDDDDFKELQKGWTDDKKYGIVNSDADGL
jgi:hypothetical protein